MIEMPGSNGLKKSILNLVSKQYHDSILRMVTPKNVEIALQTPRTPNPLSRTANLNWPASAGLNHWQSNKRGVRGVSSAISPFLGGDVCFKFCCLSCAKWAHQSLNHNCWLSIGDPLSELFVISRMSIPPPSLELTGCRVCQFFFAQTLQANLLSVKGRGLAIANWIASRGLAIRNRQSLGWLLLLLLLEKWCSSCFWNSRVFSYLRGGYGQ